MPLPRLGLILSLATLVAAAHADTKPVVPPPEQTARKVLAPDAGAEAAKNHPELKEQIEKLKAMTPEERQAWMKEHPELREKLMQRAQNSLVPPKKREDFLKEHPELKEQIEKLKDMTPEERQAWVKEHPELAKKIMPAMREAAGNGTSMSSSVDNTGTFNRILVS